VRRMWLYLEQCHGQIHVERRGKLKGGEHGIGDGISH
jgi:hypothetical protein